MFTKVILSAAIAIAAAGVGPVAAQSAQPAASIEAPAQTGAPSKVDGEWWALADRIYYEPLLAEGRAARIFVLVPAWSKAFPHSAEPGNRFAWQITLGRELPIVGWQAERIGLQRFSKGKWGIGLWAPVSFHMIEDFKDESNPIVDTDYRFGAMVKFQAGITDSSWLALRFVPLAHESTHLGDEYTIVASARRGFERVNVSYEYREYGVSYERAFDRRSALTIRHGGISLIDDKKGYYADRLLGAAIPTLTPSAKNFEPSFGVEYRLPSGGSRQFIASVDVRNRLQYSFHRSAGEAEHRRLTWTMALGRTGIQGDRRFLRSYFGYFNRGVNPYGQLREQYPYWSAGIGWIFQ